jgi:hypothetical protein
VASVGQAVVVEKRVAIVSKLDGKEDGHDLGVGRCKVHERLLDLTRHAALDRSPRTVPLLVADVRVS